MVSREKNNSILMDNSIGKFLKRNSMILFALIIMFALLAITSDSFFTSQNIKSVLCQISINGVLAFGMATALIIGGIDLSVGSVMALCGCICVQLINMGIPAILSIFLTLLVGLVCGMINGLLAAYTTIPAFIITLATQQCFRGAAYLMTGGKAISCFDETFCTISTISILGIPLLVYILILVMLVTTVILNRTKFGRGIYATGGNRNAATYSGIKVKKITAWTYVIPGVYAALAGIILASRVYSAQPTAGTGYEGDAIAASVLGGVSFSGGIGSAGGVMIGILIIGFMNNGLNMLKVSSYWQLIAKGLVILAAVYLDTLKSSKRLHMTAKNKG